jgi:alkylation response protein AidB-like acyl-CoA dehydrogenase
MASALGFEHGGAGYHAAQTAMVKHALAWARRPSGDGALPIADPTVRRTLARAAINSEVGEVLCRRQIWADVEGIHDVSYGPMAKMFSTEAMYADASAIVAVAAPQSLVRGLDPDLDIVETTMRRAIAMTVYGGTSEIHRSLIAERSLGMPKSRE